MRGPSRPIEGPPNWQRTDLGPSQPDRGPFQPERALSDREGPFSPRGPFQPEGPFSPTEGPFSPTEDPFSPTEGLSVRQRVLKIGRGQTEGPSQTDRGPFQPKDSPLSPTEDSQPDRGPSQTDRGPSGRQRALQTFLSRQKALPDQQKALRFGKERTGGPSQLDRGPSGSEKGPPVVLCHAGGPSVGLRGPSQAKKRPDTKLSQAHRGPSSMGRRWSKSDRRTAETLKNTMEGHLRQTEGLMRPIGCSLAD